LPGEEGYELFFIEAGTVSVLAIEGSEEREITTLSQGASGMVVFSKVVPLPFRILTIGILS